MYSLTVPEAGSLISKFCQGHARSKDSWENPFLLPPNLCGSGSVWLSLVVFVSIFTWLSPPHSVSSFLPPARTLVIGFRIHLDNPRCSQLKILNLHLQKPFFFFLPNKVTFTGSRELDVDRYFGGHHSTPYNQQ